MAVNDNRITFWFGCNMLRHAELIRLSVMLLERAGYDVEAAGGPGTSAISGWTVTWAFANGQTVSQAWNATLASSGASVTSRGMSYNSSLAAGADDLRLPRILERHEQRPGGDLHRQLKDKAARAGYNRYPARRLQR